MKPSVTIPEKLQLNGSLSEPAIHGHSRPNAYQAIHFIISQFSHPKTARNSPLTATVCTNGSNKFKRFGPKFWDRSNGHLRPQANQYNILHHSSHISSKQPVEQNTDCSWVSKPNISVPRFGTDQTAVQGLNQPKHSQSA